MVYNLPVGYAESALKFLLYKNLGAPCLKLLMLTALVWPLLVPAGFMAQRNAESGRLEVALCPSGFSQSAIDGLTGAVAEAPSHLSHHADHTPLNQANGAAFDPGDVSHHTSDAAELCALGGPGVFLGVTVKAVEFGPIPSPSRYLARVVSAKIRTLQTPPVRGPPSLS